MRPDPTDIIIKKRLHHSRQKADYSNVLTRSFPRLIGVIFFSLMASFISLNFDTFVSYVDRPITKIRIEKT